MKKFLLMYLLAAIIFGFSSLKSQNAIDDLAEAMANNVVKKIKKMPETTKIAITFFLYEDDYTDTAKTYLSIKLSKSFAQQIRLQIQNNKLEQKILFPNELDDELYESMQNIYTIPDDVDEAEYWKTFLDNQTPDYYLVGKYKIIGNYESIQLKSVQIIPSPYGKYVNEQPLVVKNATQEIKTEDDKNDLSKINIPLSTISQTYQSLIDWTGTADFFDLKLLDKNSKSVSDFKLIVGDEYQVSINLDEDAYVYAFFYDPVDKNYPFISMLFPYQNGQDTYLKAGMHFIPPGGSFVPDPPAAGQVFIKIFASKTKIPITLVEEIDSDGYIVTKLNEKNCSDFISKINSAGSDKITTRQITLLRTND